MDILEELWNYYAQNGYYIIEKSFQHMLISSQGVLYALIVGVPIGILMKNNRNISEFILTVSSIIQTIPVLAMLAFIMLFSGLGANTVIISIFLYSLLPIIQNTYSGISSIDNEIIEAGIAVGMTKKQLLFMIELPLSFSFILGGIKTALVVAIGLTTLGAFIGSGGLGSIIIRGTSVTDGTAIILAGAIPAALLAILSERFLWFMGKIFTRFKRKGLQIAAENF